MNFLKVMGKILSIDLKRALLAVNSFLTALACILFFNFLICLKPQSWNFSLEQPVKAPLENKSEQSAVPVFSEEQFTQKTAFNCKGAQGYTKSSARSNGSYELIGVSAGEKNLALIRNTNSKKQYYCSEGDQIEDYKVRGILKDRVILESKGKFVEVN